MGFCVVSTNSDQIHPEKPNANSSSRRTRFVHRVNMTKEDKPILSVGACPHMLAPYQALHVNLRPRPSLPVQVPRPNGVGADRTRKWGQSLLSWRIVQRVARGERWRRLVRVARSQLHIQCHVRAKRRTIKNRPRSRIHVLGPARPVRQNDMKQRLIEITYASNDSK